MNRRSAPPIGSGATLVAVSSPSPATLPSALRPEGRPSSGASASASLAVRRGGGGRLRWSAAEGVLLFCLGLIALAIAAAWLREPPVAATLVVLAGRRNEISMFNTIDRFCLLLRAIRSFDFHVNRHYGPYPIHVLVATDHDGDDMGMDAPYTDADRALIRSWAPHSTVVFVNVTLYDSEARSPGVTDAVVQKYRELQKEKGQTPPVRIGYAGMCRLWSFRLQAMKFLTPYDYYMRMDDDSVLVAKPRFDPFVRMRDRGLQYAWRRDAVDPNGVPELWEAAQPYLTEASGASPFGKLSYGETTVFQTGRSPYNNFHVSSVKFWRQPAWTSLMQDVDHQHLFYRTKMGDATAHAMATMLMRAGTYERWPEFPYRHNNNDMGPAFHREEYKQECKRAYVEAGIPVPNYEYRD